MGNICFCGKEKRGDRLVCPRCYELYRKEAPKLLAQGQALELIEWVEEKATAKLAEFIPSKEALKVKKGEVKALQREVRREAFQTLRERLAGKRINLEIIREARGEIERELWKKKGGNRLYAELKKLEEEVTEETTALQETLQQIKEIKRERTTETTVDKPVDSAFPNQH